MARFAKPKVANRFLYFQQHMLNPVSTIKVDPISSPSSYNDICPIASPFDCTVIKWPNRVAYSKHIFRISIPPCKNIRYAKSPKPKSTCASFTAFDAAM